MADERGERTGSVGSAVSSVMRLYEEAVMSLLGPAQKDVKNARMVSLYHWNACGTPAAECDKEQVAPGWLWTAMGCFVHTRRIAKARSRSRKEGRRLLLVVG